MCFLSFPGPSGYGCPVGHSKATSTLLVLHVRSALSLSTGVGGGGSRGYPMVSQPPAGHGATGPPDGEKVPRTSE